MGDWVTHLVSTFGSAARRRREVLPARQRARQLAGPPRGHLPDVLPARHLVRAVLHDQHAASGRASTRTSSTGRWPTRRPSRRPTRRPTCSSCAPRTPRIWWRSPTSSAATPPGRTPSTTRSTMAILQLAAAEEASSTQRACSTASTCTIPSPGKGLGDTAALWDSTSARRSSPHVQGWINSTYPGTGICVSEYNVANDGGNGNTPDPSTGAQEADILGMYGRLGYRSRLVLDDARPRPDAPARSTTRWPCTGTTTATAASSAPTRSAPRAPTRGSTSTPRRIRRRTRRRSG